MAKQNKLDMRKEKKHLAEAVVAFHQAHHAWYNYDGDNTFICSNLYLCRKNAERTLQLYVRLGLVEYNKDLDQYTY